MQSNTLSIVVPCYNEEKNIPIIFSSFSKLTENVDAEIIFVENGSSDNSEKVFNSLISQSSNKKIKILKVIKNEGYGNGILKGLEIAEGDIVAWTHADLQTDPKDVLIALQSYLEHKAKAPQNEIFIKGTRKKRRIAEAFFSWTMGIISSAILGSRITEVNAQPKLFSRSFYEKSIRGNAPKDFSLDLFTLYMAKKSCSIYEIPVFFNKRIYGEAKGGGSFRTRIKLIERTLKYIFELRKTIKSNSGVTS